MCGIAGTFHVDGRDGAEDVRAMLSVLRSRGPDFRQVRVFGPVALGHTRLSIIDPSPEANQPFEDAGSQHVLVLNGEIYNYRELKSSLEAAGYVFRTTSDTEVALNGILHWGIAGALERFIGMFAFAFFDHRERRLYLARDRMGEKPLVFFENSTGVAFASDMHALIQVPWVDAKLDVSALKVYLGLNYVPTSRSLLRGVRKLRPGYFAIVEDGRISSETCYWDPRQYFVQKTTRSRAEVQEQIVEILRDSTHLQLRSDVPVGAFLSGGVDSSAVVRCMRTEREAGDLQTFSMGFEEHSYDESSVAATYAEALSLRHESRFLGPADIARVSEVFAAFDEPFADSSMIPTFFLCEMTRRHVTVALSGDGGDELFGGYVTYQADILNGLIPAPVGRILLGALGKVLPPSQAKVSLDFKIRQFARGINRESWRAHSSWRTIFWADELSNLLLPETDAAADGASHLDDFRYIYDQVRDLHPLDQAMYLDLRTWLVDDVLVKLDRCAMAHSLEARAPFLDHRLVSLACTLPPDWRVDLFGTKRILKRALASMLPHDILRRKKRGFNAPVAQWLKGSFGEFCHSYLFGSELDRLLSRDYRESLWKSHREGRVDNSLKLLGLVALADWLIRFRPSF